MKKALGSLVNAIPINLVKNIPCATTTVLIFDLSTERLFETFPAAQEKIALSLLVSLVGGILGETAAAVVSHPADAVISELKKGTSDMSLGGCGQEHAGAVGSFNVFRGSTSQNGLRLTSGQSYPCCLWLTCSCRAFWLSFFVLWYPHCRVIASRCCLCCGVRRSTS